jgi:hypothetical protein
MISDDTLSWNVSNLFLIPLLNIGRERLRKHGFVESFLYNAEEETSYDNCIYLLFNTLDMDDFNMFINEEKDRTTIIEEFAYPDYFMMVAYELPKRFKKDYQLLIQGKYSLLSKEFKKNIPMYVKVSEDSKIVEVETVQHMVLSKSPELKEHFEAEFDVVLDDDQELWKIFDKEKETFRFKNYEKFTSKFARRVAKARNR